MTKNDKKTKKWQKTKKKDKNDKKRKKQKSRELFELCSEYKLPVEINGNGLRNNKGYPNRDFWTIAKEYDLQFIINADSHAPNEIYDEGVKATYKFADELGITVTERLEF